MVAHARWLNVVATMVIASAMLSGPGWQATASASDQVLAQAAPKKRPLIQRLDPTRRAKVLAAIAGLVILGFGMVLLTWLGARATRRYMNREPILHEKPPEETPIRERDWADKPLGSPFDE